MKFIGNLELDFFEGRVDSLKKIFRYLAYKPMYYRSSVYFHSLRVYFLLNSIINDICRISDVNIDKNKVLTMALVHDDAEIITGDILAGFKEKFSSEQINEIENDEINAIKLLKDKFPHKLNNYDYSDLLLEIFHKNTIESQLVKYIDHFDAFGEAMHEIYSGNERFINHVFSDNLGKIELPHLYYINRFNNYKKYYTLLSTLIEKSKIFPLNYNYEFLNVSEICKNGNLQNMKTFKKETGYLPYDFWKNILLKNMDYKYIEELLIKKE